MLPRQLTPSHLALVFGPWNTLSPWTQWSRTKALRRLLRWLEAHYDLHGGCIAHLPRHKKPDPRTTKPTSAEVRAVLAAAPPVGQLFIHLIGTLGLRHGTAFAIAPSNWDTTNRLLTFHTKGQRQQQLPVPPAVAALLDQLTPQCPQPDRSYVYNLRHQLHTDAEEWRARTTHGNSRYPVPSTSYVKALRNLLRVAGVRTELRPHDFRRYAAEQLWQHTKDLRKVQTFLGHKDLTTTARYLAHCIEADSLRGDIAAIAKAHA